MIILYKLPTFITFGGPQRLISDEITCFLLDQAYIFLLLAVLFFLMLSNYPMLHVIVSSLYGSLVDNNN